MPTLAGARTGPCERRFDGSNGNSRWQKTFTTMGSDSDSASAVTYGRNGDIYALVGVDGPVDFGVPIIGAASPAAVMLRIAP